MIKVGFLLNVDENWLGGLNYFKNLIGAILATPDLSIRPVIFTGRKTDKRLLSNFNSAEIIETPVCDRGSIYSMLRKMDKRLFVKDRLVDALMKQHNIDILSHLTSFIGRIETPTIGWIPDFQHVHLPHMFQKRELIKRNRTFLQMCINYNTIIVSSYDAQQDLSNFAPEFVFKSKVLQFVVEPPLSENEPLFNDIENAYNFIGPFFYVPNQYWQHKNHLVILKALTILKNSGRNVLVISTGNTRDYRQSEYYGQLKKYIYSNNLTDTYKILGTVPYSHVISLTKNCIALINPSFFEGWSTTVEEAKALGKRIILSDINVHREQNPIGGIFFNPNSPEELAEILWRVWNDDPNNNSVLADEAIRTLKQRRKAFAKMYEQIVMSTLKQ